MKTLYLILIMAFPFSLNAQTMNVVTFNIRYNNPGDGINAWPNRIDMVTGLLRFHEPAVFGLQEALHEQIIDINNNLAGYEWFGAGRDDGQTGGEYSPIFFRTDLLELMEKGQFWLSESPETPGKGWDAAFPRIVTWGKFKIKDTGQEFYCLNTHFDHVGIEARKNSADMIIKKVKELNNKKEHPIILMGDFNLMPDEEPIKQIKNYMRDAREVSAEPVYGPTGTFSGFDTTADLSKNRIDYIFLKGDIKVLKYAVLTDWKEQRYPSDHLPVFAKIKLK